MINVYKCKDIVKLGAIAEFKMKWLIQSDIVESSRGSQVMRSISRLSRFKVNGRQNDRFYQQSNEKTKKSHIYFKFN